MNEQEQDDLLTMLYNLPISVAVAPFPDDKWLWYCLNEHGLENTMMNAMREGLTSCIKQVAIVPTKKPLVYPTPSEGPSSNQS